MNERYDVIIVGAGPGGSSAACSLAERGFRVLLIDKEHFPREKVCGDGIAPRAVHSPVSYTHLRAHETVLDLVCRLLLDKNKD